MVYMNDNYCCNCSCLHDDVIQWNHFPRYWPVVRGIYRSPMNYPHKDQSRWAVMFYLISAWVNNREAGDLRRHRAHYDVTFMVLTVVYAGSNLALHKPLQHDSSYRIAMTDKQLELDFLNKWMSNRGQHITSLPEPRFCCWPKRPIIGFIHLSLYFAQPHSVTTYERLIVRVLGNHLSTQGTVSFLPLHQWKWASVSCYILLVPFGLTDGMPTHHILH